MKTQNIILILLLGTTLTLRGQKNDSIVVNYNKEFITIPVPDFGKQTTIKLVDSVQTIEFSVTRQKTGENSVYPVYKFTEPKFVKTRNKAKWFSQIQTGYALSVSGDAFNSAYISLFFHGCSFGLSVREKVRSFDYGKAFVTGFEIGYQQSWRKIDTETMGNNAVYKSFSYNLRFPFALRYAIHIAQKPAQITFGTKLGLNYMFVGHKRYMQSDKTEYDNGLIIIEPFAGVEFKRFGFQVCSAQNFFPDMIFFNSITSINSISLTYRLY